MDIDSLVQPALSFFRDYWILLAALAVILLFIGSRTLKVGAKFLLLLLVVAAFFLVIGIFSDVF